MAAEIAEPGGAGWTPDSFATRLDAARAAVAGLAGAAGELSGVADEDVAGVMSELTTRVGQLDGLRVEVARTVRQRGLYRLRGARNVCGWLRADARTADDALKISRLAAMAPELPRITGLLAEGSVSLAQAGAAAWQVSHLPDVPARPEEAEVPAGDAPAADAPEPDDELWAGLWRGGDVHAAADQLFAEFMPGMDAHQLRELGAHLCDAADAQERAGEDYDDFTKRAVRISRSLGGAGEVSGRLHPEAAEQVIAAFEELGAPAGPDDPRTKAQRWADVLTWLAGLAGHTVADGPGEPGRPGEPGGLEEPGAAGEPDDDQPGPAEGHDHGTAAGHDHDSTAGDRGGGFRFIPPPRGWRPGTIYRHGKPVTEAPAGGVEQ